MMMAASEIASYIIMSIAIVSAIGWEIIEVVSSHKLSKGKIELSTYQKLQEFRDPFVAIFLILIVIAFVLLIVSSI